MLSIIVIMLSLLKIKFTYSKFSLDILKMCICADLDIFYLEDYSHFDWGWSMFSLSNRLSLSFILFFYLFERCRFSIHQFIGRFSRHSHRSSCSLFNIIYFLVYFFNNLQLISIRTIKCSNMPLYHYKCITKVTILP